MYSDVDCIFYNQYHNIVSVMPVEMSQWHGRHLSVFVVILELQLEHVLLDLSVPERLADATTIGAKEVVGHVGVEVDVVLLADKVPLLGSCLELLVVP